MEAQVIIFFVFIYLIIKALQPKKINRLSDIIKSKCLSDCCEKPTTKNTVRRKSVFENIWNCTECGKRCNPSRINILPPPPAKPKNI